MKICLLLLSVFTCFQIVNGQGLLNTATKIYLVRHAEKQTGNDPALTDAGLKRAGDLYRLLKNKNLHRIYVTQFRRTQMTGDTLRIKMNIDTVHYRADTTGDDLMRKIIANGDLGKTILVIGHSNTIPLLVRRLDSPQFTTTDIPDYEYNRIYFMKFKKKRSVIKKMKYGAASYLTTPLRTMQ